MMYRAFLFSFLLIVSVSSSLLACGGSCLECHSKLKPLINDTNHIVLNTCINCHTTSSPRGQCGQDCFECHSKEKFYAQIEIKEHQAIKACNQCHQEKVDFTLPKNSMVPAQQNLIQLFK